MNRAMELALVRELLNKAIVEKVTEAAIRARYDMQYPTHEKVEEVHLRVIVLPTALQAQKAQAELAKGTDFAQVARTRSVDPSGVNGGDIGFVQRRQLPPALAGAVFALAVGAMTQEPILNQEAWHIFRLEARHSAPVPTFDQAHDAIRQELVQEVIKDTSTAGAVAGRCPEPIMSIRRRS